MPRLKILLDECVDRRLANHIPHHEVNTVHKMGWTGLGNGELLEVAQEEFSIFLTTDRNLSYQQNLSQFNLAVAVLRAPTNRLEELVLLIPAFLEVAQELQVGQAYVINC